MMEVQKTKPRLWKIGANLTADVLITRKIDGRMEMIAIRRRTGEWAIPGGFLEEGEAAIDAATRELVEETGIDLDGGARRLQKIWSGRVEDPRNTEDRWIETTLYHCPLTHQEARSIQPRAGSDAQGAAWMELRDEAVGRLYADHPRLVRMVLDGAASPAASRVAPGE